MQIYGRVFDGLFENGNTNGDNHDTKGTYNRYPVSYFPNRTLFALECPSTILNSGGQASIPSKR